MNTYTPKHGDRTYKGLWFDGRSFTEDSTLDEMLAGTHTPDCDIGDCTYNALNFTLQERTWGELTYHADDGLWLCPTHWAEFYTYQAPLLLIGGTLAELKGAKDE